LIRTLKPWTAAIHYTRVEAKLKLNVKIIIWNWLFLIDSDGCELIANRAKCVNDKDPELMQEMIRYEDENHQV
jgi:hypothetical protein